LQILYKLRLGTKISPSYIDHITITTPTLQAGAEMAYRTLGVNPAQGGEHPKMAMHNLLLRLGDSIFLEVIAPNPSV